MQIVWQAMHSGKPRRSVDGVIGRIMRSLLQLRASEEPRESQRVGGTDEKKTEVRPSRKVTFREAQIEMAHGAGGKASRRLIEGLFVPLLYGPSTEFLVDAAHVNIGGTSVALTTDS